MARRAGISHGLVLFHFASKEGLLTETLRCLAAEYRDNWQAALATAGPTPQTQLAALLDADFNPTICAPAHLATWCAFLGKGAEHAAVSNGMRAKDDDYIQWLAAICAALIVTDGSALPRSRMGVLPPARMARVLRVTTDGVWLDMMTMTAHYTPTEARATVPTAAAAFFPDHFSAPDGRFVSTCRRVGPA